MKRTDIIIDFETLSINKFDGVVLDCSLFAFEWERFEKNPYTFDEIVNSALYIKADVKDQMKKYNYKVQKDTLGFWEDQPPDVRKRAMPTADDLDLDAFTTAFFKYVRKADGVKFWWSRNNTFDPIFAERLARDTEKFHVMENLLPFWGVRDVKTWIDAKFNFASDTNFIPVSDEVYWNEKFKPHNSTHDVAADVMRLQTIYRAENDLTQVAR